MTELDALFAPSGVAVIGASRQGGKLGALMARSLASYGDGPLLVNSRNPAPGELVFESLAQACAETGRRADLAVLCVPAAVTAAALADAAAGGVRAALVCAGGFAESGADGERYQAELSRVVAESGVRLLGPNTSGYFRPQLGLVASFVPGAATIPAGPVGIVATSGGVNHALAFELASAGTGVSLAVGIGAGADVTQADVLAYLADDAATAAVGLHVESVADGAYLLDVVRRVSSIKPVVALVVGRSDVGSFARSHTGALSTSWRTATAVLAQAGAVVVDSDREMVDALTALSRGRLDPTSDPGVGLVTAQAGPGLLIIDQLRHGRVRVPELTAPARTRIAELLPPLTYQANPVDTGRPGETFPAVLEAVAADPGVDILAVYALLEPDAVDLVSALETVRPRTAVPAVVGIGGVPELVAEVRTQLHKLGVPAVVGPAATANAVHALARDAQARLTATDGVPAGAPLPHLDHVDEAVAKDLLDRIGIPTPPRHACSTRAEAHTALAALGGPVAVKLLDPVVAHKTELGGVHLGIASAEQLDAALDALDGIGARRYLVEAMAAPGVELVVGTRRDPVFGPVVLLGCGGTAAEVIADVVIRCAPLSPATAAGMVEELSGRELLRGWRGGPVADEARLGQLIAELGAALAVSPHIDAIDINPLRVTTSGLIALDATVFLAGTR